MIPEIHVQNVSAQSPRSVWSGKLKNEMNLLLSYFGGDRKICVYGIKINEN